MNCHGNQQCVDRNLDGAAVTIEQDLGIFIIGDVLTPVRQRNIGGRTAGRIAITPSVGVGYDVAFHGSVTGDGECASGLCSAALAVRAQGPRGARLSLDLAGTLLLGGGAPEWASLEGSGIIGILVAG